MSVVGSDSVRMGASGSTAAAATITFAGSVGDSSNLTIYSATLACGDGGDMVVSVNSQGAANQTISSWTLGGQTITTKASEDDGSEVDHHIGTVSGVGSGNQTLAVTFSGGRYRMLAFGWVVENVYLVTPEQAVTADALGLTFSAYLDGSVVAAGCSTASSNAFSGATGITYDGNLAAESNATGGNDLSGDASTTFSFTGTSNRPLCVGLELAHASDGLTETAIAGATGTILGDFTSGDGAGEAAAFDGNTDKALAACARTANSATGFIGKDWGSSNDKLLRSATYHGANNSGVCETDTSCTFALQGSATGSWGGEEVELANSGSVDKSANNSTVVLIDTGSTAYRYHRVYCTGGTGSEKWGCAELVFTERV